MEASHLKAINGSVALYVDHCSRVQRDPIFEVVELLSDKSAMECILNNRKQPLDDEDCICAGDALKDLDRLRSVNLEGCDIPVSGVGIILGALIGVVISESKSLKTLNLSCTNFGAEGCAVILSFLASNSSVEELTLDYCHLSDIDIKSLIPGFVHIKSLSLQGNDVSDVGMESVAALLARDNCPLASLNVRFNNGGNRGASFLGNSLRKNGALRVLDIGGNNISEEGATAIANGLSANSTLEKLNLRSNDIGEEGAKSLAAMLEVNTSLNELYLGGNDIGDGGTVALAEAVSKNQQLSRLDLQGAHPGRMGMKAMSEALRLNRSLTQLVLDL